MKIVISDIPDEGLELEIDEALSAGTVKLISPVKGNLSVKKVGQELIIQGEITAKAEFECSRCLKSYTDEICVPVGVTYHPLEELKPEGKYEVKEDELDTDFYAGDEFDLLELIKEQIVLNVPMKLLCSEACKGICPKCGTDLNINKCNCSLTEVDSRLEILKDLLRRE
ncbi:MAG: hypothetical protein FD156_132 [Nitrospirae bacterium]|nr:MAG: hypothetical protein FD156_132 [Nitrospirota bacterium]